MDSETMAEVVIGTGPPTAPDPDPDPDAVADPEASEPLPIAPPP